MTTTAYLGEIRPMSFGYAPDGWALCNGQLLAISQYPALYELIGTIYGGDGQTTFALPDLRGRTPLHEQSHDYPLGRSGGAATVALDDDSTPAHSHQVQASLGLADTPFPTDAYLAATLNEIYSDPADLVNLSNAALDYAGDTEAHDNLQPYLTISFCIALEGEFPTTETEAG